MKTTTQQIHIYLNDEPREIISTYHPSFLCLLKDLKEAFKIFDKNKNGFIEMKELRMVTTTLGQKLTEEEFQEFWKEADVNHDGKLDYMEFVEMITKY